MYAKIYFILFFFQFIVFAQTNDDNNRFMLAQNFEQAGEFARAKQIYQELYNRNPGFYLYFESLNRMFVQLKEYPASESLLINELKRKPDDINLIILLGKTYYTGGNEERTDSLWNSFLNSKTYSAPVYRAFANSSLELRNFDMAVFYLKEARERTGEKIPLTYEISNLLALKMQYQDAVKELLTILDADPGSVRSVEARILSFIQKPGALEESIKLLKVSAGQSKPYHHFLLASLYRESGRFREAFELLKKINLPLMNNGGEIFNLASAAAMDEEFAVAADAFSFIISEYPKSSFVPQAKLGLAKNLGRAVYTQSADSASAWKPLVVPAKFSEAGFNGAIGAYREIIKIFPYTDAAVEALYYLAKIYFDCGDSGQGEIYINEIMKNYPMSPYFAPAVILLSENKTAGGKFREAELLLDKVFNAGGNAGSHRIGALFLKIKISFYRYDFVVASGLINSIYSELRDNNVNDALEFSLLINPELSDSSGLAEFASAEFLLLQGKFQEAYAGYIRLSQRENLLLLKYYSAVRKIEIDIAFGRYTEARQTAAAVSGEKLNIFADKAAYYGCLIDLYGLQNTANAVSGLENFLEKFPTSLYYDKIRGLLVNLQNKNI